MTLLRYLWLLWRLARLPRCEWEFADGAAWGEDDGEGRQDREDDHV